MRRISEAVRTGKAFLGKIALALMLVAVAATLATTVLVETGIASLGDPSPLILLTGVVAMVFVLGLSVSDSHHALKTKVTEDMQRMHGAAARIEETQKGVDSLVRVLSADVRNMRETLEDSGKLWSLDSAVEDLDKRFEGIGAGERIEIDHLGLSMEQGWENLYPLIDKLARKAHVSFHLLILGSRAAGGVAPAANAVPALPRYVEKWAAEGDFRRPEIEAKLSEVQAKAGKPGAGNRSLVFEVRSYRDIPLVHGIRVRKPFHAAYMAIARWDDRKIDPFWWGDKRYHRILDPASADQIDLRDILDGYFRRWWTMNDPAGGPQPA